MVTITLVSCCAVLSSCSDDKISGDPILSTRAVERNTFDRWLYKNYTMPYDIDFQYRLKTEETGQAHNFIPADSAKAVKLTILTGYMQFDAYTETVELDFTKENAPRTILMTDTPGHTRYHTEVISSAEDDYKVRLNRVNILTDEQLKGYGNMNSYYFHTMHHEFIRILDQRKPYDEPYGNILRSDYVSGNWTSTLSKKAQSIGFVSAYSMENSAEGIAELYPIYMASASEDWATIIKNVGNKGGTIINKKLKIIREYMSNSWDIDIELLHNAILRRGGKIGTLDSNALE